MMEKKEWLEYRKKGIGSSDAPIIHGESPYKNIYDLYLDKTTPVSDKDHEESFIQAKGHELEIVIRKKWAIIAALELGIESEWLPLNVAEDKVMRASLDGYDIPSNTIAEFKFQGKKAHEEVKKGFIPLHYWIQVQHQLLVSGAKKAYLVSYNDELDTVNYREILPDRDFFNEHIKKCREFWEEVTTKTPGEETLSFKKEIKNNSDSKIKIIAKKYADLSEEIKNKEKELEELKKELIKASGDADKTDFEFLTVTKSSRAGSVDYKNIPELKGVDLEKYRKPSTEYFLIKVKQ